MDEPNGLERVPDFLRESLRDYASLLRGLAGANAKALTLFGAVVEGPFDPARHTVRSVLVLGKIDLDLLRRVAEHGKNLGRKHICAPLVMTPEYIRDSRDTFPLELIEIHQHHVALFGDDPFQDLTFADADVRLQCERELKVMLIGLRQGLLAAAGREEALHQVEVGSTDHVLRLLRGLLWLRNERQPQPASAVIDAVERAIDRKLDGVRTAMDPAARHGWHEFQALYRDVDALGELVNAW